MVIMMMEVQSLLSVTCLRCSLVESYSEADQTLGPVHLIAPINYLDWSILCFTAVELFIKQVK